MLPGRPQQDECMILIKALPHRSSKYSETVCCAGVGIDQKWRRQYPVPFRILKDEQKFKRWQWISYQYVRPTDDPRKESQKVQPESVALKSLMKKSERADFLAPLICSSFDEANSRRDSLTLIRPVDLELSAIEKSRAELEVETIKHRELANQLSMFDNTAEPLTPCRMQFRLDWKDQNGKRRSHECDDWETSAAFNRFEREYGAEQAIRILKEKYEDEYFKAGLTLAFSTHKRRNVERGTDNQWLLVGMVRLNETLQASLAL